MWVFTHMCSNTFERRDAKSIAILFFVCVCVLDSLISLDLTGQFMGWQKSLRESLLPPPFP